MLLTKEEATEKACPYKNMCIADWCMAWRWTNQMKPTSRPWTCPECEGKGRIGSEPCFDCEGAGKGVEHDRLGYCHLLYKPEV